MATLEEQRRASGQAMQNSRRANGQRIEDERRAIGNRMIEERTGKSVAADLNRLTAPQQQHRRLKPVAAVGGVPAGVGRGVYKAPAATTAGIASPLTEQDYALRQFWAGGMPSSDGLLVLPAWKRVVMTDANGAEVIFEYAEPTP